MPMLRLYQLNTAVFMKNIAICGSNFTWSTTSENFVETIKIEDVLVHCGLVHTQKPDFIPNDPVHREQVLVQKYAFSCNYRDKNLILKMATAGLASSFYAIGSEFAGVVVAVGGAVTDFRVGDRVIADNYYSDAKRGGVAPGIPSNNSSREYQIFHSAKLIKIPPEMPDEVAAAFGLGAQTSYSMIRKLDLTSGARVLVTAARSNTSLFVIQALQQYDVEIYATTTSPAFVTKLEQMGVEVVIPIDPNLQNLKDDPTIAAIAHQIGGFDAVVDPFFDLHLGRVVDLMAFNARYITCGFYDQYSNLTGKRFEYRGQSMGAIMTTVMLKNLHIIGNCLGQTNDLKNALQDYADGKFNLTLDSVFSGNQVGAFFDRTYNAIDRLGKVVYRYS